MGGAEGEEANASSGKLYAAVLKIQIWNGKLGDCVLVALEYREPEVVDELRDLAEVDLAEAALVTDGLVKAIRFFSDRSKIQYFEENGGS